MKVYTKKGGFTLVELLIVISIIGVLTAAAATTVSVVMKTSTTAMEQNRELGEVHMAGSWISRDMKKARSGHDFVQTTAGSTLCSMQCYVGEGFITENVTYLIDIGERSLKRRSQPGDGSAPATTITIARLIAGPGLTTTWFSKITDNYYNLTVTADYNGSIPGSVTRIYKMKQGY